MPFQETDDLFIIDTETQALHLRTLIDVDISDISERLVFDNDRKRQSAADAGIPAGVPAHG